ncbi:MAG TPA: MtrAB system histidine kinase MtrB [Frankiaceae bacterium]|jgi:two-component system sensor histidine kinase MtrB|nr:MtrAB system histidine kinase MtrB [Frankiaceae bacterium]
MWRRSLRLRVVALTLLLSSVVMALLGVFLLDRVGQGLLADKRQAALGDVSSGLVYARAQLASAVRSDPNAVDALVETIDTELGRRGSPSGLFDVAVLTTNRSSGFTTSPLDTADIPHALRLQVRGGAEAETYANVHRDDGLERALIIGAPVSADVGSYEVYYVFPLHTEEQTLGLVRRVLLLGGAALVGLLAAVVWLVSRQVVTPVRMAARIAERFAAGNLAERMAVHGDDEIARLAASFNDMAGALQRQIDQLEDLSRAQRRFTADVSHELRTPLATIRMAADVLYESRGDFPPAMSRSAEILTGQLERFERLLADLLEISRYDARAAVLEPDTVDLAGLVRNAAAEFTDGAARAGTRIDLDIRGDLTPAGSLLAEVDPRRVARILRNLLANAIDHAEGATIEVALVTSADTVAIRVLDHGVGLRAGDSERVFDRFWRADPSRSRATGGTGLGLSIAREDARLHGGELVAWGRPGEGASFRLLLPRRAGGILGTAPLPLSPDASLVRAT